MVMSSLSSSEYRLLGVGVVRDEIENSSKERTEAAGREGNFLMPKVGVNDSS